MPLVNPCRTMRTSVAHLMQCSVSKGNTPVKMKMLTVLLVVASLPAGCAT